MKFKQIITIPALLMILIGCASSNLSGPQINKTKGEINLYSSRHYDSDKELYQKFTRETGIKINVIEGKDDELIERIKNEANNSPADVFITVDVGRLWRAQQEGILQPVNSSSLKLAIPKNLRSPEGYWVALTKRARVIIYNPQKIKVKELSTYEDLAEKKWKGRLCLRSSGNIYNQSLVASMIEKKGETKTTQWVKGLVNNLARPPQGNDIDQIKAVASGQCDVSLVNQYYLARLLQSKNQQNQEIASKVKVFFPNQQEDGTHINISGAGIAKNAPHQENALKFLEYLVTPEAQAIFADANNEYPVTTGVKMNQVLTSFGKFKESPLDVSAYGEKNADAVRLMDKAGWK